MGVGGGLDVCEGGLGELFEGGDVCGVELFFSCVADADDGAEVVWGLGHTIILLEVLGWLGRETGHSK